MNKLKDFGIPPTETSENLRSLEIDKRTLRKTGRIHQFNTAVSKEWLEKLKQISYEERLKYVEVLEKALEIYEREKRSFVGEQRKQSQSNSNKKKISKKQDTQELYPHYSVNFTCDKCGEQYEEEKAYSFVRDWNEKKRYSTYCSNCVVD